MQYRGGYKRKSEKRKKSAIQNLVQPHREPLARWRSYNSDQSHSAWNIQPAPGKNWFTVGQYEWWEYDYIFLEYSSFTLNLFSAKSNTKACLIESLKTCLMCFPRLHSTRDVLLAISPITAHQTTGFVNRTLPNWQTLILYKQNFACHFSHCSPGASNNWFCEPYPIEMKECEQIYTSGKFVFLISRSTFPEGFLGLNNGHFFPFWGFPSISPGVFSKGWKWFCK